MKAALQCSYVQTTLSVYLTLPGHVQKPPTAPGVSPSAALRRCLGVLCVLESGEKCSLKILPGNILAVLAFGAVSLRVLDLGRPYAWPQPERVSPRSRSQYADIDTPPPIAQLPPPFAPQARTWSRASRDGDSSGDFEAPEDAEAPDQSVLVDDVRAAPAPNAETGGPAAFKG